MKAYNTPYKVTKYPHTTFRFDKDLRKKKETFESVKINMTQKS